MAYAYSNYGMYNEPNCVLILIRFCTSRVLRQLTRALQIRLAANHTLLGHPVMDGLGQFQRHHLS